MTEITKVRELRPAVGRTPPHDLDAESSVLSAIFLRPESVDEVRGLLSDGDAFYSHSNRDIFKHVTQMVDANEAVDLLTVANHLRASGTLDRVGGSVYLSQLIDATPSIGHVTEHAQIVHDKWRVRQCIATAQEIAATGYGEVPSVQELLETATDQFGKLAFQPQSTSIHHVREILSVAHTELQLRQQNPTSSLTGLTTGFIELDAKCAGWTIGLHIVAARPGVGKTSLALGSAVAGSHPKNEATVCFFSMEMPKEQIAQRLIASEARANLAQIRNERVLSKDWSAIVAAVADTSLHNLWVDDTPGLTVPQVRAKLRKVQAISKSQGLPPVRAVFLDYLQLMQTPSRSYDRRTREQEVSEVSRALKALSMTEEIAVIALAQLNRDVEKRVGRRPQLSDLRESGSIEQDADTVMFVHRQEMYDRDPSDDIIGIADLIVAKQRNGPLGDIKMRFTAQSSRFDNLAHDDEYSFAFDEEKVDFYDPSSRG